MTLNMAMVSWIWRQKDKLQQQRRHRRTRLHQTLKCLCVKGQNQQNERPTLEWEKTSVKSTLSEKGGLISKIYKELLQINQK